MEQAENIIEVRNLTTRVGGQIVHDKLDLDIKYGEKIAIIGSSGCGKTTLIRAILMLLRPTLGSIKVFGVELMRCSEAEMSRVRQRWGVMFQGGALYSSLTVLENIMFPFYEETNLSEALVREIALFKIGLVGLPKDAAMKFPAELSGGMKKRAAMARTIALDPELVILDEPTAGLDPKSADNFDNLLLKLHDLLGMTLISITHDLDTLWRLPDRVIFLGRNKVLAACPMAELVEIDDPDIQAYFSGPRGQQQRLAGAEA